MTSMSRRTEVKDFVDQHVAGWHQEGIKGIKVPLTCGCGPLIDWVVMHEFQALDPSIAVQIQYVEGADGRLTPVSKQSPPFAIKSLDEVGLHQLEEYVDRIITESLDDFIQECCSDDELFQQGLLCLLANIYRDSEPDDEVSVT